MTTGLGMQQSTIICMIVCALLTNLIGSTDDGMEDDGGSTFVCSGLVLVLVHLVLVHGARIGVAARWIDFVIASWLFVIAMKKYYYAYGTKMFVCFFFC